MKTITQEYSIKINEYLLMLFFTFSGKFKETVTKLKLPSYFYNVVHLKIHLVRLV